MVNILMYDSIFQWDMSNSEAEVYKLAATYESEFLKIFKDVRDGTIRRKNGLPKRTDPRKSNLFRYCWKLRRETRGLLEPHEYTLYIRANLTILHMNYMKGSKAGKVHVEPNAICGDKAWIRWKVYERWYKNKQATMNATLPDISSADPKVIRDIDRTKRFLYEKCEGEPTLEKIKVFIDDGVFKIWILTGKLSKYYVAWSPFVSKCCNLSELAESCAFDETLFQEKTSDVVKEYLAYEFGHEVK